MQEEKIERRKQEVRGAQFHAELRGPTVATDYGRLYSTYELYRAAQQQLDNLSYGAEEHTGKSRSMRWRGTE